MRIDHIDLLRFGHFADRQIELSAREPDFYVLYGNNEAGKSTLLRAISALFFGVPNKTQDTHTFKGPELRVGATVSNADKALSFRRRKGTNSTLLSKDEEQIPESVLAAFLPELDHDRFEQFFALNHDRLREGGEELLRGRGDIGSALFQAAGLLDLRKLLDGLNKEAHQLFSPRSRGKVIGTALEEYKRAKSETRQLAISAATVKQKRAELQAAQEILDKLRKESEALQQELIRLRRIANNKPDVARLQELRITLLDLEWVPPLPTEARRERNDALIALSNATEQIEVLTRQIAQRKERIASLPLSTAFDAHAKEIDDLNSRTRDYTHSVTDLPKRARKLDEAIELAESEWKQVWPRRPISDADELRSTYFSQKADVRRLVTDHALLTNALKQAETELRRGEEEYQRISQELKTHPNPPDPAVLLALIDQGKSLGEVEQVSAGLKKEIARLQSGATRDLNRLGLFSGNAEQLAVLQTPLLTTIDRYGREVEKLAAARKEAQRRLENATSARTDKQSEANALETPIRNARESDLTQTRARRDELWRLIRAFAFEAKLSRDDAEKQSGSLAPLPDVFAEQLGRADQVADLRFTNAKDVAIHDRLLREINAIDIQQKALEADVTNLEREESDLRQCWDNEWSSLQKPPLPPAEMKEWMLLRQAILERVEQCSEKEDQLRRLQDRSNEVAAQIIAQLDALNSGSISGNESLAVCIQVGERLARELEQRRRSRAEFRERLQSLAPEGRRAQLQQCETKLLEWSQKWTPLVRSLLLSEVATPGQVSEALDVLETVFGHLRDADGFRYRVKAIGDDIEAFKQKAAQLIDAIDPSLASLPPEQAVEQLHSHYVQTGRDKTERNTREAENHSDELAITGWTSKRRTAETALAKLREAANCEEDNALLAAIGASEQRDAKRKEYEGIASGLIQRNAVPELQQIEEEASGHELDTLRSQIESGEAQLKELQEKLIATGTDYGELRKDYERLEKSTESSLQAQKAEDALAKVRPAVSQYLRLCLASEAVQRAIESYREKHQGPVLKRASEIFSTLTLHDYSALAMAFSSDDRPILVAARKSGEKVEVEGLSDGTRDQLYLALRLAFIEHHVATVAPCPVIFDDILINFDDARSLATLQVLNGLAMHTQVLFFTHHRRLAELGIHAGADVVEFGNIATAAIA